MKFPDTLLTQVVLMVTNITERSFFVFHFFHSFIIKKKKIDWKKVLPIKIPIQNCKCLITSVLDRVDKRQQSSKS